MKRSYTIRLMLLGTGLISMTACEQNSQSAQPIFKSEQECQKQADPKVCIEAFNKAKEEHIKTAPRFMSLKECEEKFGVGKCAEQPENERRAHGGGIFMPMMMGFMMGNMMSGLSAQPVYMDKSNNMFSKGQPIKGGFGSAAGSRSVRC